MWKEVQPDPDKAPFAIEVANGSLAADPYLAASWRGLQFELQPGGLSIPESRVFILSAFGLTRERAADLLDISTNDVKRHVQAIFDILKVESRFGVREMPPCVTLGMERGIFANVQHPKEDTANTLGLRERWILQAISEGMTHRAAGETLNISEAAVKALLQDMFGRFSVLNSVSGVLLGELTGQLPLHEASSVTALTSFEYLPPWTSLAWNQESGKTRRIERIGFHGGLLAVKHGVQLPSGWPLTPPEETALLLKVVGMTNRAIGKALGKSPDTVRAQIDHACVKLNTDLPRTAAEQLFHQNILELIRPIPLRAAPTEEFAILLRMLARAPLKGEVIDPWAGLTPDTVLDCIAKYEAELGRTLDIYEPEALVLYGNAARVTGQR